MGNNTPEQQDAKAAERAEKTQYFLDFLAKADDPDHYSREIFKELIRYLKRTYGASYENISDGKKGPGILENRLRNLMGSSGMTKLYTYEATALATYLRDLASGAIKAPGNFHAIREVPNRRDRISEGRVKIVKNEIRAMVKELLSNGYTLTSIAKLIGTTKANLSNILHRDEYKTMKVTVLKNLRRLHAQNRVDAAGSRKEKAKIMVAFLRGYGYTIKSIANEISIKYKALKTVLYESRAMENDIYKNLVALFNSD